MSEEIVEKIWKGDLGDGAFICVNAVNITDAVSKITHITSGNRDEYIRSVIHLQTNFK